MRVLILVLASDSEIYNKYQELWRKIPRSPHTELYFYKANPKLTVPYDLQGDTLTIQMDENYGTIYEKTRRALKFFESRLCHFNWVLRSNLSSFFILDRYIAYLETLPKAKCVEGIHFSEGGYSYPSGCGFSFTVDIARLIIDSSQKQYIMDDVTIGKLCKDHRIPIIFRSYYSISSQNIQQAISYIQTAPYIFHLRVRTHNRNEDISNFKLLLEKYIDEIPISYPSK